MLGELDLVNFLNLSQNDFYRINSQDGQYYYGLSYADIYPQGIPGLENDLLKFVQR